MYMGTALRLVETQMCTYSQYILLSTEKKISVKLRVATRVRIKNLEVSVKMRRCELVIYKHKDQKRK